jgi:site-specific DNA recombinase
MKDQTIRRSLRSAIYTRVSTEQGLEQDFNSLDAQREACEAYIRSQAHEGWRLVRDRYDDGGFPAGRWIGRRCRSCSSTCRRDGST